jgi:hypothetical protein
MIDWWNLAPCTLTTVEKYARKRELHSTTALYALAAPDVPAAALEQGWGKFLTRQIDVPDRPDGGTCLPNPAHPTREPEL